MVKVNCEDSDLGICTVFEDLRDAGQAYATMEFFAIFMALGWLGVLILESLEFEVKLSFLGLVFSGLTFFFHFLAFVVWIGVSEATFSDDCEAEKVDEKGDLCALVGP
jgi:hypothetical protein